MNDDERTPTRTSWTDFMSSPLALFAGIFSLLEGVVLIYLCGVKETLAPLDGVFVVVLTVALFALIVISRPEALYPPEQWVEPAETPEVRGALKVLQIFIVIVGGAWAMRLAGDQIVELAKVMFLRGR
jgi:hypothetical protein